MLLDARRGRVTRHQEERHVEKTRVLLHAAADPEAVDTRELGRHEHEIWHRRLGVAEPGLAVAERDDVAPETRKPLLKLRRERVIVLEDQDLGRHGSSLPRYRTHRRFANCTPRVSQRA